MDTLFKLINHGVYVIGVADGERRNAFTAAWVMQVSFKPPLLAISINPHHYSFQLMQASGICSVNVLDQHQLLIAEHFGRSDIADKMSGFSWQTKTTGAPILTSSLAYFDCEVSHYTEAGDHQIAVCHVLSAAKLNQGQPLLYAQTGNMDGSQAHYK